MLRRVTAGLMASGAVLYLAAAASLTGTGVLVVGTVLLTIASVLVAIALEEPELDLRRADARRETVDAAPLEPAA